MSKKTILLIVAVVIIVALGAFAIFNKSDNPSTGNTNSKTTSSSNTPSVNNAVVITKTDSKLGKYLADPSGKALYTYDLDTNGVSKCTGGCLSNWPAYVNTGSTTGLPTGISTIKRTDNGQMQYTYNGKPLYYFTGDSNGKVTGDGVESFSVAKPAASSQSTTPSSSSSTPSSNSSSSSSSYPY